jgi:hypothetical protein
MIIIGYLNYFNSVVSQRSFELEILTHRGLVGFMAEVGLKYSSENGLVYKSPFLKREVGVILTRTIWRNGKLTKWETGDVGKW